LVVEARRGEPAGRELDLLLHRSSVATVSVTADHVEIARQAWRRYGKGRHPAGLNFGDCFAYALARSSGEALLYVGEDFTCTDISRAE
jgi:ribonuclease VapC